MVAAITQDTTHGFMAVVVFQFVQNGRADIKFAGQFRHRQVTLEAIIAQRVFWLFHHELTEEKIVSKYRLEIRFFKFFLQKQ